MNNTEIKERLRQQLNKRKYTLKGAVNYWDRFNWCHYVKVLEAKGL